MTNKNLITVFTNSEVTTEDVFSTDDIMSLNYITQRRTEKK